MTEDQIKTRMEELMTQGRQLEMQIHMINGALEQCKWSLTKLENKNASEAQQNGQSV
jgi:dynactin complex subunit